MLTKDKAICIRAVDYSETSQVVTFFTSSAGRISAIAKGSKRRKSDFGGPIEILARGTIVYSHSPARDLSTLTEFEQAGSYDLLRSDFFGLNCGYFAAEMVNDFTGEYDPHSKLFEALERFLERLQSASNKREALSVLVLFQLVLLREVGLQPLLNHCINCGKSISSEKRELFFSSSGNGIVCRDCEKNFPDRIRVSSEAGSCLLEWHHAHQASEKTLFELEKLLVRHLAELAGKFPKMAKYILPES